jgi:phage terminase large subunit-like protein
MEFAQKPVNFARPTAEFESLVIGRKLRHNGHPILAWQVGHCAVKEYNGLMRPIRPNRGDYRTVDGVLALVMALGGALEQDVCEVDHSFDVYGNLTL